MSSDERKRFKDQMKEVRKRSSKYSKNKLWDWDNTMNGIVVIIAIFVIVLMFVILLPGSF